MIVSVVGLARVVLHEVGHNMGMGHQGRNKECSGKGNGGMIKAVLPAGQVWTECNKDDFFYLYQLVTEKGLDWCLPGKYIWLYHISVRKKIQNCFLILQYSC